MANTGVKLMTAPGSNNVFIREEMDNYRKEMVEYGHMQLCLWIAMSYSLASKCYQLEMPTLKATRI